MNKLLLSILIVLISAIVIVALLLQPANSTSSYWLSTFWIIILVSANWFASAAIFVGAERDSSGTPGSIMGSLPAVNILIFFFSIISISLLVAYNSSLLSSTFHLVLQIVSFTAFAIIILLTLIAAKGAGYGTESAHSKKNLLEICRDIDKKKNNEVLSDDLRLTINHISFKMRHPSKIDQDNLEEIVTNLKKYSTMESGEELRKVLAQIRTL
tara:strand:+ start:989 stop:1627 length:639 start_codon:yes stop_codon:yes gene_type:complete